MLEKARENWKERLKRIRSQVREPTRLDLIELSDKLRSNIKSREIGKRLRSVADGEPFADEGERDGTLWRLLCVVGDHWPQVRPEAMCGLFARSVSSWADEDWDEKVAEKWQRVVDMKSSSYSEEDDARRDTRRRAWAWADLERDDCAALGDPLVVHAGRAQYLRIGPAWIGPWTREEMTPDVIARMRALYDIQLQDYRDLLTRFGARAARIVHSLETSRAYYENEVLTLPAAPRRALEPEFSPRVEMGLLLMAGPYHEQLRRWIAGLSRPDLPCRALVLSGEPHTGKSLLLVGLSRLWLNGPANLRDVVGKKFNESVLRSGFAMADDEGSTDENGKALAMHLRQAVTTRVQTVEKKFQDSITVAGCMRFCIATNDVAGFIQGAVSYKLNDDSIRAFGDRILHIPVQKGCEGWYGDFQEALTDGDEIARHALWLAQQYDEPEERFWVGPADTSLGQIVLLSSGLRGDILIRLGTLLEEGESGRGGIEIHDEHISVYTKKFVDLWVGDLRPRNLSYRSAGLALKALSFLTEAPDKTRTAFRGHNVKKDFVVWFARKCGVY